MSMQKSAKITTRSGNPTTAGKPKPSGGSQAPTTGGRSSSGETIKKKKGKGGGGMNRAAQTG